MSFKEFFKPTAGKIILLIILSYPIFLIILFLTAPLCMDCAVDSVDCKGGCYSPVPINLGLTVSIIITIIISYILSCIIVLIYNKLKKSKTKK